MERNLSAAGHLVSCPLTVVVKLFIIQFNMHRMNDDSNIIWPLIPVLLARLACLSLSIFLLLMLILSLSLRQN